jgi:histidine ammonia-lyase
MGDVTPLAHLTKDLLRDFAPAAGEALPLIAQSSFVAAYAAIAMHDTKTLLDQCVVLGGLDLEAFACNPTSFHPSVAKVRPYPGYCSAISRISDLLEGSQLMSETPRSLQPPLSFRCTASVLGTSTTTTITQSPLVKQYITSHITHESVSSLLCHCNH